MRSVARLAVALYPKWWKQHYGENMESYLEDLETEGRSVIRVLPDLIAQALITRITGVGMPANRTLWLRRTRASISVAVLPGVLLFPLMIEALQRYYYSSGGAPLSTSGTLASDLGSALFLVLIATGLVLLWGWRKLADLSAALPKGRARRRYSALVAAPFIVSVSAFVLWGFGFKYHIGWMHTGGSVTMAASWISAVFTVARAAGRAPLDASQLRSGVRVARVLAICTALFGLLVSSDLIALANQTPGHARLWNPLAPEAPLWITIVIAGAIISMAGARSAGRAMQAARKLDLAA